MREIVDEGESSKSCRRGVIDRHEAAAVLHAAPRAALSAAQANASPLADAWDAWLPDPEWPYAGLSQAGWDLPAPASCHASTHGRPSTDEGDEANRQRGASGATRHRHRLAPEARGETPVEAAQAVVVLHSTDPVTVYLSTWARTRRFVIGDLERALYDDPVARADARHATDALRRPARPCP